MPFELPVDEVLIGTSLFTLRKVNKDAIEEDTYGNITYSQKLIKIAEDQDEVQAADTVVHELFHGIFHSPNLLELERALEEKIIKVLSPGIIQVFRDNPELILWLLEKAKLCRRTKDASTD